MSKPTSA
jgi:hypothetical protein